MVVCFDCSIISPGSEPIQFCPSDHYKELQVRITPPLLQKARPAHLVLDLAENSIFEIFCEAGAIIWSDDHVNLDLLLVR